MRGEMCSKCSREEARYSMSSNCPGIVRAGSHCGDLPRQRIDLLILEAMETKKVLNQISVHCDPICVPARTSLLL